jgi:hypothetical protein
MFQKEEMSLREKMSLQAFGETTAIIAACFLNAPLDVISSKQQVSISLLHY